MRLAFALAIAASGMIAVPAVAQQERVNRDTGNYEPAPDNFSSDWPKGDPNAPSPYNVTKRMSLHVNRRVDTPAAVKPSTQSVTQLSDGLVSLGGMSMYDPDESSSPTVVYPSWWPK
jgi:hypothetical protein